MASYANKNMAHSCIYHAWFVIDLDPWQMDLLSFQSLVAQILLKYCGTKPSRQGRRSSVVVTITGATRFDSFNNWPCKTGSGYKWCKNCGWRTPFACGKCYVPLYVECIKKYHPEHAYKMFECMGRNMLNKYVFRGSKKNCLLRFWV